MVRVQHHGINPGRNCSDFPGKAGFDLPSAECWEGFPGGRTSGVSPGYRSSITMSSCSCRPTWSATNNCVGLAPGLIMQAFGLWPVLRER